VTDVLMAYATRHVSTRQVAEVVTAAMREAGAHVTALPARAARESVTGYDLVVLGTPLYSGALAP
jgi:menaquinone-dependent protoporphyrinogen oxidase